MLIVVGGYVILRKNYRKAKVEKQHPRYSDEYVVSYYDNKNHNKLCYDIIKEDDVLSDEEYEKHRNRINKLNALFRYKI